eukprot:gnl/MRDRNA2_/MRDRNA2_72772_c0_seq1.p1 gnl/MRDRNA2_/MRDRNA2_72772_c0~~gnl/MRDRNA2_/MRDRNA2_72772_c0_seq1.p1  ORF type:complete len:600 (-),score=86.13 gnl/MRDRNA2_/MRDRNA2_72772_c0_seq1:333-2132(-)
MNMNSIMNVVILFNYLILATVFTNLGIIVAADENSCKAVNKAKCTLDSTAEAFVDVSDETHLLQTKLEVHEAPHSKGTGLMASTDKMILPKSLSRTNDAGSNRSLDCAVSFAGLDELLATPFFNCGQQVGRSTCTWNVFNPTFQSTHNRMGPFYGHARLLVVRNCHNCPHGNAENSIKRHCVNECLESYKARGLRDKFWFENFVDGTFGGWMDPQTCSFQVDAKTFQPALFDRRDFGEETVAASMIGYSTMQRKENTPPQSIWTYLQRSGRVPSPSPSLESTLSSSHANLALTTMRTEWTRMVYSDAFGPCWNECKGYIPSEDFHSICPDATPESISIISTMQSSTDLDTGEPLSVPRDVASPRAVVSRTSQAKKNHRKIAFPGDLHVQEKNWSPFSYHGKLLFVYTWQPFRVCQLEDPTPKGFCNLCREISSTKTDAAQTDWLKIMNMSLLHSELEGTDFHLNGLPIVRVRDRKEFNGYLGVGHAINSQLISGKRVSRYTHFFFRMSSEPPFQVLDMSAPIELKHEISSAVFWSNMRHEIDTSFVSGFSVLEETPGQQEILIAYGDGDSESRLLRLSLSEALSLFPKPLQGEFKSQNA